VNLLASDDSSAVAIRLNKLLDDVGLDELPEEQGNSFGIFLSVILRWNSRTNLTSVRDEESILSRHFVECIATARVIPPVTTLLDYGSGAGLPGIPIAICRSEIVVTLAESQGKKAAFLQEAVRALGLEAIVHSGRAEDLTQTFDCVVLRAVDKMADAVSAAARLVKAGGWMALMTSTADVGALQEAAGDGFTWRETVRLPASDSRILALGLKASAG
jgi:16S rRNA (guanine527-N7)-methyltransferase